MAKAVIFDVDGTLIDSVDQHADAWLRAFQAFGVEATFDEVRAQIGKGADQMMPVFLSAEQVRGIGPDLETLQGDIFKGEHLPRVRAFPKVRELFERIRSEGGRIVLATSAKGDELERYKEIAGIGDLLEAETSSDDAERSKPAPDIFQAALARLAPLPASQAVVVGDTPWDAKAAVAAGLRPVGVLSGGFPEDELRGAGCIAVFQDPADLLARFEHSPLAASQP